MRLRPFHWYRPVTVEQASELLNEFGHEGVPYWGGTELLLVAKLGLTDFAHLIDLKGIAELQGISPRDANDGKEWNDASELAGELWIGAGTTHRQLERSPLVGERWASLAAMERDVANLRVRTVGTIGGNLCFADPHSDPATYLIAAGAAVSVRRGGAATRRIDVEQFIRGPYQTALEPGELLVAVHVPAPVPGTGLAHRKIAFHERPAATVACAVQVASGAITSVRIAVGSVGIRPIRVTAAEACLVGADPLALGPGLAATVEAAARHVDPVPDANGSVEYKRQLVRVLVDRCVRAAAVAATENA